MVNEQFVQDGKKRRVAVGVTCGYCNKHFLKRKDHAITSTSHFCSTECFNLEQKGKLSSDTERRCTKCGATKVLNDFYDRKRGGKRSACKLCWTTQTTKRTLQWQKANPALASAAAYTSNLKIKYNLTQEEYDKQFKQQNGVCAVCGKPEIRTYRGVPARLSVDHCHITGEFRGLLCNKCNTALGLLNEDPELFARAVMYLSGEVIIEQRHVVV